MIALKKIWKHFSAQTSIPLSYVTGEPLLTLSGNDSLLIENHFGIAVYEPSRVVIRVCSGYIEACGSGFSIETMNHRIIRLCGLISSVRLVEADEI